MRNNFHYGFGTRLTAVVLTLLMVLSLGGFVLRGEGADEPLIFDESYGTPVPEDTAAPEATEVPAESTDAPEAVPPAAETETPAPEATEEPAQDTPVPEETAVPEADSGTDTNTTTSEPEATPDPQMTPAPEAEPTAAPEGDTPADEAALMDEPLMVSEYSGITITLTANKPPVSGESVTYTLSIENKGSLDVTIGSNYSIQRLGTSNSEGSISTKANCTPTFDTAAERDFISKVSDNQIDFKENTILEPGDKVSVNMTLKKAPGDLAIIKFKVRGFFGSEQQYIVFSHASEITAEKSAGIPDGAVTGAVSTAPAPGGGGGEDEHCGVTIIYHLNNGDSDDPYI